mgnify:CR=1 FL=1|jgi:hypothetical protein
MNEPNESDSSDSVNFNDLNNHMPKNPININDLTNKMFVKKNLLNDEIDSFKKIQTNIKYNFPSVYKKYITYYLYCYINNFITEQDKDVDINQIIDIYERVNKNNKINDKILDDLKEYYIPLFKEYLIHILHIVYSKSVEIHNKLIRISYVFEHFEVFKNITNHKSNKCYWFIMHLKNLHEEHLNGLNFFGQGKNNDNIKSLINSTVNQLNSNYNRNILQMYVSHILPTITFDNNITETNITEIKKQLNKFIKNNNNNIDNKINDYILQVKNNLSKLNLKAQQYSFNESDSDY